ncbi:hypothetical protein LCGC14_1664920 [marine sediment metagenome]|uniref:Uncharacterized protein n=1 Tax=marine sediment metagenome TaxID=412755 RepID=A0A0F9HSY4_9ZZZZ
MSMTTASGALLKRSEIWASQLKEVLQDELNAQGWVNWLSEFPDGDTFTIPSIGESTVRDYVEDTEIVYDALDTGEFQFTITEYLSSGLYITEKARQDLFYASQLEASFVPSQARALAEKVETDVLALGAGGASGGQTAADTNSINGAEHRFIGTGTNETFAVADAAKALFGLKKANVPSTSLIAIVDPSVEYELNTLTNIVNMSNNPRWEGIIETGIGSGMRFIKNIFGFDFYVSNYLQPLTRRSLLPLQVVKRTSSSAPQVLICSRSWVRSARCRRLMASTTRTNSVKSMSRPPVTV